MPRTTVSKQQQGCRHYERHCMLFAPCCNEFFWCRHCHNEKKNSPLMVRAAISLYHIGLLLCTCSGILPLCLLSFTCCQLHRCPVQSIEATLFLQGSNRHVLDRHAITRVKCAHCSLEQPVATRCRGCLQQFGRYSCLECNFFDENINKKQFHCSMCGICRVGTCHARHTVEANRAHCIHDEMLMQVAGSTSSTVNSVDVAIRLVFKRITIVFPTTWANRA